jgi:hypothetical protein
MTRHSAARSWVAAFLIAFGAMALAWLAWLAWGDPFFGALRLDFDGAALMPLDPPATAASTAQERYPPCDPNAAGRSR